MPKKHRQQEDPKPEVVWEHQETPDAAERVAAAFEMLLKEPADPNDQEAESKQQTLL